MYRKGTELLDSLLKDFLVFDKSSILLRQKAVPRYDRPDLSVLKSRFVSGNTNLDCIPSKKKREGDLFASYVLVRWSNYFLPNLSLYPYVFHGCDLTISHHWAACVFEAVSVI